MELLGGVGLPAGTAQSPVYGVAWRGVAWRGRGLGGPWEGVAGRGWVGQACKLFLSFFLRSHPIPWETVDGDDGDGGNRGWSASLLSSAPPVPVPLRC